MRGLELIRGKPIFPVVCAAGALAGAVLGLFLPIRAPEAPKAEEVNWSLPTAKDLKRFNAEQYESVRGARFWGELQVPGQRKSRVSESWTMTAIVTRPHIQIAIGEPDTPHQAAWIRIGGKLPDGSILVAANRDTIWYEKGGCRRMRKLYRTPSTESDACIGVPEKPTDAPSPANAAALPSATPAAAPQARSSIDS